MSPLPIYCALAVKAPLRNQPRHLVIVTSPGILLLLTPVLLWRLGSVLADEPASRPTTSTTPADINTIFIARFGEDVGQPLAEGFVFVDGQYIEAPYRVSRRGLALFVNDRLILPAPPEMIPDAAEIERMRNTNPEMPGELHSGMSRFDPRLKQYLLHKYEFLTHHFAGEALRNEMLAMYSSLPNVLHAWVDADRPELLHVQWADGEVDNVLAVAICRTSDLPDGIEGALARVKQERVHIERSLKAGSVLFLSGDGGRTSAGRQWAKSKLPAVVAVLRSDRPEAQKIEEITTLGLGAPASSLVRSFKPTPQLYRRLEKLHEAPEPPASQPN